MAQRLVRRLCPKCTREEPLTPEFTALLLSAGVRPMRSTFVPVGCSECNDSGYKGRVGVYEILFVTEQMREAIQSGGSADDILQIARSGGLKRMQEEALNIARTGQTSLEEAFRVFTFESAPSVHCASCSRDLSAGFLYCPYCGADRRSEIAHQKNQEDISVAEVRL
jgi:type II secretory ATPase GspE/PulE/Tfp pilus assembly ATPase PilB-like protein